LPLRSGGRRNPEGKYRPVLKIDFGRFRLELRSPSYEPDEGSGEAHTPLGLIRVDHLDSGDFCQGPLDHTTWERAGQFVRERYQ
jgi:hypothetical protein